MKKLLSIAATIIALIFVSCADSISEIEKTYQRGIERAESAQNLEFLPNQLCFKQRIVANIIWQQVSRH